MEDWHQLTLCGTYALPVLVRTHAASLSAAILRFSLAFDLHLLALLRRMNLFFPTPGLYTK